MGANKIEDIEDEIDGDDGCGYCPLCRVQLLIGSMEDALEQLRAGKKRAAEGLLCSAIAEAEANYAEWLEDAAIGADDHFEAEEDDEEVGLADMPTLGRA